MMEQRAIVFHFNTKLNFNPHMDYGAFLLHKLLSPTRTFFRMGFYGSKYFHEIKILKCRVSIQVQVRTEALMLTF